MYLLGVSTTMSGTFITAVENAQVDTTFSVYIRTANMNEIMSSAVCYNVHLELGTLAAEALVAAQVCRVWVNGTAS